MSTRPFVAVAGATGGLGKLVVKAVLGRGVAVKALVRPNTDPSRTKDLLDAGADIVPANLHDVPALSKELRGATCVVSTLQGLRDVIHDTQGHLLDASVQADVPRFIPSDFSLDFTKTTPGSNRNLDLRREFHARLDASGIAWTSILNGAFLDLMAGDGPMINHKTRSVGYIGQPTQPIDFTSMKDLAGFTAAVATDPNPTPKFLRCASVTTSAQTIADTQSKVTGQTYKPKWMGTVMTTKALIRVMRLFGGENETFPAWQGMQYMENMMSGDGKLEPIDNGRYPELKWTTLEEFFREHNPAV
jgi:uncharacterized protein YbjT (DUF2867 family)